MTDLMKGEGGAQNQMHSRTWNLDPFSYKVVYHLFVILTEMRIFSKMRINWGQNLGEILVGLRGEAASIWQHSAIFC